MNKILFIAIIVLLMPLSWAYSLYNWFKKNKTEVWGSVIVLIALYLLVTIIYCLAQKGGGTVNQGYVYGEANQIMAFSFLSSIAIYVIISIFVIIVWGKIIRGYDPGLDRAEFWPILQTYFLFSSAGGVSVSIVWYCVTKGWFV